MRSLVSIALVFICLVAGAILHRCLISTPVSAAPQDSCSTTLYPTGCFRFDTQTLVCGNDTCGNGFYPTAVNTGNGDKALDFRTTPCTGGNNCPSVCAPTAVTSYSSCPTPTPPTNQTDCWNTGGSWFASTCYPYGCAAEGGG